MDNNVFNVKRTVRNKSNKTNSEINYSYFGKRSENNNSYLTYIVNGEEKIWKGKFSKLSDGTYVYSHSGINRLPLEERYSYNYKTINSHFSYYDSEGHEMSCNILDSIEYDPESNTYTGEIGVVEYKINEIEIYPVENK